MNERLTILSKKLIIRLLVSISVLIQVVVITYSHMSGYYTLHDWTQFASKLIVGSLLTFLGTLLLAYPDLAAIRFLNRHFPWNNSTLSRVVAQLLLAIVVGCLVSVMMTGLAHLLKPYVEPLREVLINNALIFSVCNLMLMMILEGWVFFIERAKSRKTAEALEREMSDIRYEVLKTQINPHFMFNSLNVLSGLIEMDKEKAQRFINEFSQLYRYVLETIDQYVVTVEDELRFARSYMYLQQIRYGQYLRFSVELSSNTTKLYLPPLSLQIVLENAVKHNLVSKDQPLSIAIFERAQSLVVSNTLQLKESGARKSGIGQTNLSKRYALISSRQPKFSIKTDSYEAELPLLKEDTDESADR